MSRPILLALALGVLVWLSLRLSARALSCAPIDQLPARYRRRMKWWLANATHVQLACIGVVAAAVGVELGVQLSTALG